MQGAIIVCGVIKVSLVWRAFSPTENENRNWFGGKKIIVKFTRKTHCTARFFISLLSFVPA